MRRANQSLTAFGLAAIALALFGSAWLAKILTEPIGRLSTQLAGIAGSRGVGVPLPLAGSSRELDALTDTFNELMASVAAGPRPRPRPRTPARSARSRLRSTRAIPTPPGTRIASACWRSRSGACSA